MNTRGSWFMRDRPVLIWLLVAVVISLLQPFIGSSRWLLVHVVALGGLTHAVLVWSVHFTDALLKTKQFEGRRTQSLRLGLFQLGIIGVFVGVPLTLWPLTLIGAIIITAAVLWHGLMLVRRLRAALPGRFRITVRYYVVTAMLLPIGAGFGVLLAHGPGGIWHGRLLVAHTMINLLGWVGMTVLGTLVTLWPTILRTRMAPDSERRSQRALPTLLLGLIAVITGPLIDLRWLSIAGIGVYLLGALIMYGPILHAARNRRPTTFPALSVASGLIWLVIGLLSMGWKLGTQGWAPLAGNYGNLTAIFLVGFALQVLLGALSYLLPVVIGGGPAVLKVGMRILAIAGPWRIIVVNTALIGALLPGPTWVRVPSSVLVLLGFAISLALMLRGIYATIRTKRARQNDFPLPPDPAQPGRSPRRQVFAAVATIALGAGVGLGLDPAGFAALTGSDGTGDGTGAVTEVTVTMEDMRFHPERIDVPTGNRLVIELVNTDDQDAHDLVTDSGASSGRVAPGKSTSVDVGVVEEDIDGWCSVVGHREQGMTLDIHATAATSDDEPEGSPDGTDTEESAGAAADAIDFSQEWESDFTGVDPALPSVPEGDVHEVTLTVTDEPMQVAPGVRQTRWTYNGSSAGPTLHGEVGDSFEVTLVNDGTMGHSVDFHASHLAPDEPMRSIPPGESLTYTFTADRAGAWMYHCGTEPMGAHIAAGMAGAVIIEPEELPEVDRSYVITQSELYLDPDSDEVDATKVRTDDPDGMMFNGFVNQYRDRPLQAEAGDRVRFWVVDIGPNRPLSFHIVGAQFDTVYKEGAYLLRAGQGPLEEQDSGGSQALDLLPAQGGFVETTFPEAGQYSLLNHIASQAEQGAQGIIEVSE